MTFNRDRVLKFGGAALADAAAVRHVVELAPPERESSVLVVSAHQGVTRALDVAWQATLSGRLDWEDVRIRHRSLVSALGLPGSVVEALLRELGTLLGALAQRGGQMDRARDLVLSYGERLSARLVAAALREAGTPAFAVDAFDLGLEIGADGLPTDASSARVRRRLDFASGLPVITGFLALDRAGNLATLGPDGSDLTAVWLGGALAARRVELYKSTPGWLTVAPEHASGGETILELPRVLAQALARHGANVLHPRAMDVAGDSEIVLIDVNNVAVETRLVDRAPEQGLPVAISVEAKGDMARITVAGGELGREQSHAETWANRVGTEGWLGVEAERHTLTVNVAAERASSVTAAWHTAILAARSAGDAANDPVGRDQRPRQV